MDDNSQTDKLHKLGNTHFQKGDYLKAISFYTKAISLSPKDPVLRSNLSTAFFRNGQFLEAECEAYASLRLNRQWWKAYFCLARAYLGQNRSNDAIAAFQQALKLYPDNQTIVEEMKTIPRVSVSATTFSCVAMLQLSEHPHFSLEIEKPEVLRILHLIRDNPESAREFIEFNELIGEMINFVMINLETNSQYYNEEIPNGFEESILRNEAACETQMPSDRVSLDDQRAERLSQTGNCSIDTVCSLSTALECVNDQRLKVELLDKRALAFAELGCYQAALSDWEEIVRINASFPGGYRRQAQMYFAMDQYMEAYDFFEKALVLDPSDAVAKAGLDQLVSKLKKMKFAIPLDDTMKTRLTGSIGYADPLTRSVFLGTACDQARMEKSLPDPAFRAVLKILIQEGIFRP